MTWDCIFCKIVQGEIPCKKIYEDENFLAFLDVNPQLEKHTLLIPKKHFVNTIDFDTDLSKKLFEAIKKIFEILKKDDNFTGFNILQNNFRSADQVVDHLHFHILPRKENDSYEISIRKK